MTGPANFSRDHATGAAFLLWATDPASPHLCATPFFHAAAAAALDIEVEIYFTSRSVRLLVPGVAEGLYTRTGERSVLEYMREAQELGVRFYACSDALQVHDVDRNDLLSGITGFAGAAAFMARALDRDWVTLTY
jgi:predicted peroxiredoxin